MLVVCILVAQLCLAVCESMDFGPPGSSVHGILQARILEWVAISFKGEANEMQKPHHRGSRVKKLKEKNLTLLPIYPSPP